MSVQGSIEYTTRIQESKVTALASFVGNPVLDYQRSFTASDITKAYCAQLTYAAPTTIDLNALTNEFGDAISFATVVLIHVKVVSTNQDLVIGGGTHPAFGTDQYTVKRGRSFASDTSWTITGGSSNNLLITPTGSCVFQLIIAGT